MAHVLREDSFVQIPDPRGSPTHLPPKKRVIRVPLDSSKENKRQKREDDYYEQKIQKLYNEMGVLFTTENELTERLKQVIASDEIKGTKLMMVIQKRLFLSDLKRDQNRLNMPINMLKTRDFLTPEEKNQLDDKKDIEVHVVGPRLQMYTEPMKLRMWELKSTYNYVLKTNWSNFVEENKEDLKKDATIQVWSFRKDKKLCFAILVVKKPPSSIDEC